MLFDENRVFGWDPPGSNQTDLHNELWSLTRMAARNWLKSANSAGKEPKERNAECRGQKGGGGGGGK